MRLHDADEHEAEATPPSSATFTIAADGETVAAVTLTALDAPGEVRVGGVPFGVRREAATRAYDLDFEGLPVARAERAGGFSSAYEIAVVPGILTAEEDVRYTLKSTDLSRSRRLWRGRRLMGEIRWAAPYRYTLRFRPSVPLPLRAFCLALLVVQLRWPSHG